MKKSTDTGDIDSVNSARAIQELLDDDDKRVLRSGIHKAGDIGGSGKTSSAAMSDADVASYVIPHRPSNWNTPC